MRYLSLFLLATVILGGAPAFARGGVTSDDTDCTCDQFGNIYCASEDSRGAFACDCESSAYSCWDPAYGGWTWCYQWVPVCYRK